MFSGKGVRRVVVSSVCSRFRRFRRGVGERERERAVEPLRELTCIGVNLCSEGIYVRAKQVPGIEAPQYDNAITPLLRRFSRLLSLLPSFFFSSSPLSVVRNPVFLFSPRISLLYPCRLLPCCPPINITMRKYVRTSSFVLVSRPWLQSRRSSFPYFSIRLRGEKEKRKKRGKRKKRIKKGEEEKRVMIRPTIGLEQQDSGVEMRFFSKVEDIGRPRKFGR